ncbi:hypothetical protein [Granulicella rosea]|nr:hypothetical protein [Granulicella rosea]
MSLQLAHPKEGSHGDGDMDFDAQDPRWRLAIRVAESAPFANAPLLSKFLLYVCEHTLSNRSEDLTERNIGIAVFQRRVDYKPSEDNIVRSYVRQLRQRLERYFDEQGADEPWRIAIPRGGYGAVFEERSDPATTPVTAMTGIAPELPAAHVAPLVEDAGPQEKAGWRRTLWIVLASLLAGGLAAHLGSVWLAPQSLGHAMWAEIFTPASVTYIVSADSSLATIQELSGKHTTLEQYVDGSYFAQFARSDAPEDLKLQRLSREHMTGVPDIDAAAGIVSLPEARGRHVVLRNARAFTIDDMKDANVILTGSAYSTPWVTLFEPKMNFVLSASNSIYGSSYLNKKPLPGEPSNYSNSSTTPPYSTYAVIAFLPGLSGAGKVLIVEGLTTAGSEAASNFVLHGDIAAFLKTVPRDQHGLRPFEILLKTTSLDSSAPSTEIVAKRLY